MVASELSSFDKKLIHSPLFNTTTTLHYVVTALRGTGAGSQIKTAAPSLCCWTNTVVCVCFLYGLGRWPMVKLVSLVFTLDFLPIIRSASSTGSSSTNRSTEGVVIRQPSKNRVKRQTNRFSGVFQRGPASSSAPMALTAGFRSSLSVQTRKDGGRLTII